MAPVDHKRPGVTQISRPLGISHGPIYIYIQVHGILGVVSNRTDILQNSVLKSLCGEPVWASGKALSSSKKKGCGLWTHCLVTLTLTVNETLKWLS